MSGVSQTLIDKVAVVTGSSTGIGAAVVIELANRGATVVVNFPSESEHDNVKHLLARLPHERWMAVEADLATPEGPQQLVDRVVERYGRIHILVNNAGRHVAKPFEEHSVKEFDALFNLNVRGLWLTTQAALPHLPPRSIKGDEAGEGEGAGGGGGGRIVNICSAQARQPLPNQCIYVATKGAVEALTKAWAKELPQKYNCTVNAVAPGITDTPTVTRFLSQTPEGAAYKAVIENDTPVAPRCGTSEEVAWAVAFLCEERSRWINGEIIITSGGLILD